MRINRNFVFGVAWIAGTFSGCDGGGTRTADEGPSYQVQALVSTTATFAVAVPSGTRLDQIFMTASESFAIQSRVELGKQGDVKTLASYGKSRSEFGAGTTAHASLFLRGDVALRSSAFVAGSLTTTGRLSRQKGARIAGDLAINTAFSSNETSWNVAFQAGTDDVVLEPGRKKTLIPGAYRHLDIRPRATLRLSSGTYFFESWNTQPQVRVEVDKSAGPIFIYVKSAFVYKGGFVDVGGPEGQVLVGYLGTSPAHLEDAFLGTLVAPNADIELRRPNCGQHKGSWFGKTVRVFSHQQILHVPFKFDFICPLGDTDGDGVLDCTDYCFNDPKKTDPGACDCGVADVDTDIDGLSDCLDAFPLDPGRTVPGECDGQRNGAACTDGLCAGVQTCTAGTCGPGAAACLPEPGCKTMALGESIYSFCGEGPDNFDAARAKCDAEAGQALVRIETPQENAVLVAWLKSAGISDAWIGANDIGAEGTWRWMTATTNDGPAFWQGGPDGGLVGAGYARWAAEHPDSSSTNNCANLNATAGQWRAAPCTQNLAFICEKPSGRTRLTPLPMRPLHLGEFFPGATDEDTGDKDGDGILDSCVPLATLFKDTSSTGLDLLQREIAIMRINACQACTDKDCADKKCTGIVLPAVPGSVCSPSSATERALCKAQSIVAGGSCSENRALDGTVTFTGTCPVGSNCGRHFMCAEMKLVNPATRDWEMVKCTSDAQCAAGNTCDTVRGRCINAAKTDACETRDPVDNRCVGVCFGALACIKPVPGCGLDAPAGLPCQEINICNTPPTPGSGKLSDSSNVSPSPFVPAEHFAAPADSAPVYPTDPPCPAGDGCPRSAKHPWCKYAVDDTLPAEDTNDDEKQGGREEEGGAVQFDFDPLIKLDWRAEPRPFGETKLDIDARAQLRASARFELGPAGGQFDIINAVAALKADRCRFNTSDTKFEVFGIDFLPEVGINAKFDSNDSFDAKACNNAFTTWETSVNRVKKALRDAQELLKQFNELKKGRQTFSAGLCTELLAEAPKDFLDVTGPLNCATETPIRVINRFVDYYNGLASRLLYEQTQLAGKVLTKTHRIPLGPIGANETQTLFQAQFFIGPIPALLEVGAFINYGLSGALEFTASPGRIVAAGGGDLVTLTGSVRPYAGSGVTLFVGAGFDVGVASFSAGVEGAISLGQVSLPTFASAGITVATEADKRALPPDLAPLAAATNAFPQGGPQQYRFNLRFGYGMSLELSQILAGHIDARLRVKFLFFSKTWRARLLAFEGYSLPPVALLNGGAELATALDLASWGVVKMPLPFPRLARLSASDLPVAAPGESPIMTASFHQGRVAELFYDRLCTCQSRDESCDTASDCCDNAPAFLCFSNPDTGGGKICSTCRNSTQSCNNDGDCCALGERGVCTPDSPSLARKTCKACTPTGVRNGCKTNADCCDVNKFCVEKQDVIISKPGEPAPPQPPPFTICVCGEKETPCTRNAQCCSNSCRTDGTCSGPIIR